MQPCMHPAMPVHTRMHRNDRTHARARTHAHIQHACAKEPTHAQRNPRTLVPTNETCTRIRVCSAHMCTHVPTPVATAYFDSSSCRRSTICTSRSSAIDPAQPLTAYAGTINEETDWTATSCSFHSPVTFSSRSVWTRSLRGSPMLTPSALVVRSSYTRHARSTSPSTPITATSSLTALRASRTRSWSYARRRARLRQAIQKPASSSTRSATRLCYLRP